MPLTGGHVVNQSTSIPLAFRLTVFAPATGAYSGIESKLTYFNGTQYGMVQTGGHIANNSAINFLRVQINTGNFASGFIHLYGRKSS